jgi:uncharacterized protein YkwD
LFRVLLPSLVLVTGCYDGIDDAGGIPWDGGEAAGIDTDSEIPAGDTDSASASGGSGGSDSDPSGSGTTSSDPSGGDPTGSDPTGDTTDGGTGGSDPTGDPTGDTTDGSTTGTQSSDVPDIPYCSDVADWDPQWAALEEEILVIVNEKRAQGANCGSEGSFGPAPPLTMNSNLRCSARVHSKDMDDNDYFDHTNLQGESPFDRMQQAGYSYSYAGENIAGGNSTAAATMDQWMNSDGHCSNIMNPNFEHIGVGYHPGGPYGTLWTQNFGAQ